MLTQACLFRRHLLCVVVYSYYVKLHKNNTYPFALALADNFERKTQRNADVSPDEMRHDFTCGDNNTKHCVVNQENVILRLKRRKYE